VCTVELELVITHKSLCIIETPFGRRARAIFRKYHEFSRMGLKIRAHPRNIEL
jgi:hypothetical protein